VFAWVHPLDLAAARRLFERSLDRPGIAVEGELRAPHGDDGLIWLGVRSTNLLDDPDVRGIVVSFHDITDRKLAEAELEHLAFHDSLTGLPNRALFSDRVGHALDWASTRGEAAAVLLLDLDGFKVVNDSLGHAAGDELLQVAAARLADAVGLDGSIARLGGDELAVLVGPVHGAMAIAQGVAERVQCALADPVELEGRLVTMSASIGIAGSDGQTDVGGLLRDADVALYQAKAAGKAQWVVFRPPMRAAAVERLQLETDLPLALERHELALAYQPVVDLASGRVAGFEALLRWHHPVLGLVGPDRFIALAEETGHIVPIGAWVLEEACRTAAQWQRLQPTAPPLTMAVNVSARQLASDDLVTCVASALRESGLDPRTLVLEVTETSLVTDPGAAARRLQPLRELGVRVAIDDFGTGHSSLSYLRQLPVDILKIDRSFVRNLADAGTGPALVQTLIDLGRTLDLEVIAEGVEDAGQRDWLRAQRCHQAQGYLFARPLARDDAELLLLGLPGESPVLAPAEVRPG
jgi:diguanylate cyclase (GGDEF)-like protein